MPPSVSAIVLIWPTMDCKASKWLETFAADIATLRRRGQEVILVSSGAIALGRRHLSLGPGKLKLEESQAAAAVGQIRLAHAYKELLDAHGITVAQILLTLGDTEQRRRYLNVRGTLNTLLALGAVPVNNENDTVATAEIRYGDNDRAQAERETCGHIKVVTSRHGRIFGATVVGAQAGELITTWTLAIAQNLNIRALAGLVVPYPTLSEVGKRAAMTYFVPNLTNPWVQRIIGVLRRLG